MFKNKLVALFVLVMVGVSYMGGMDNTDAKKVNYEEIENIVIISE